MALVLAAVALGATATAAIADPPGAPPVSGPGSSAFGHAHSGFGFQTRQSPSGTTDVNACSYAVASDAAHCNARVRVDSSGQPAGVGAAGVAPHGVPSSAGYAPADLQAAYATPSGTNGAGVTVAIVDAYDDPNAEADLAAYRSNTGLPPCTTANGCFKKVNQSGAASPLPAADPGWSEEISLDVDMVSAICPLCNILLVEASSNSFGNLGAAVNRAASMGAVAISNSYGGGESFFESSYDSSYFNHPGIAVTASSGDSGYGVEYPAASPNVVAVGGTSLKRSGGSFTETAWSGAGSGCSAYEAKPSWQKDSGCSNRTVADVSAVADPNTGVWVFDSYGGDPGWEIFGGTSVASPIIASMFALASGTTWTNAPASYLYQNKASLHDVISGSNGSCGGSYLCTAVVGYDGPTGLGTPNTAAAFAATPPPPPTPDFSVSASPSNVTLSPGASTTSTITLGALNTFSGTVNLQSPVVSGPSSGLTATTTASSLAVPPNGSTSLNLNAASGTTPGTYTVTVTATSGSLTHSTQVTVTVPAPDFTISVSPTSRTVTRGSSTTYTVTITRTGGFTGNVTLSVSGQTSRDTATFSPNPITTGTTSTLTIKTSTLDSRTTRTLTIRGTSGSLSHSVNASISYR